MGNQKCLVVNCGLFVVQVGTASFRGMVGIVIVTEWFIYRQIQGTGALDLLDFKHAAPSALSQTLH
jgi:hypothetical protein